MGLFPDATESTILKISPQYALIRSDTPVIRTHIVIVGGLAMVFAPNRSKKDALAAENDHRQQRCLSRAVCEHAQCRAGHQSSVPQCLGLRIVFNATIS